MNRAGSDSEAAGKLIELMAPDVRIDMSRRVFNPDVYEGHAGLRRLGQEVGEVWEEFKIEPERFIEKGDRVVVIERRTGRGEESGLEARAAVGGDLRLSAAGRSSPWRLTLSPEEALAEVEQRLVGQPG